MYRFICVLFLVSFFNILLINGQNQCTDLRYVDDLFTVQLTQEPAIYGTAPSITPLYFGENVTFSQDLSFDFYEPDGDTLSKRPLIIMAFGGAFLGGSKRQAELVDYCEALARKGYCVASIDYRINFNVFSTNSAIRAVYRGMQDFKAAVRYFRSNATMYNVDPNHIFGGGNSAGSINAMHAAYTDDSDRTTNSILAPTFDTPDLGCLNCSGNTIVIDSEPTAIINLWGGIGQLIWMESDEAVINSFHGLDDTTVSPNTASPFGYPIFPQLNGSIPIHDQADVLGIVNELDTFPGEGHELWNNTALALQIQQESSQFLYEFMKPTAPTIQGDLLVCLNSIHTYDILNPIPSSKYCWSVNGGTVINENNNTISIQWTTAGTGNITVIERTCMDVQSDPVQIMINIDAAAQPTADFTNSISSNNVQFMDNSTGASTYLWDFGDGNASTMMNPLHTYATSGMYQVVLIVTNAQGCEATVTYNVNIVCANTYTVVDNPTPSGLYRAMNWVSSDKILMPGSNVMFKAGNYISLLPIFEVNLGDEFLAEIEPCN